MHVLFYIQIISLGYESKICGNVNSGRLLKNIWFWSADVCILALACD